MDKTSAVCVCVDTCTSDMTKVIFAFTAQFKFNLFCCLQMHETRGSHFRCRILYTTASRCSIHSIWYGLLNRNGSEHCQFVLNTDGRQLDSTADSLKYRTIPSSFMEGCYKHHCTHFPTVKSRLGASSTFILLFLSPQKYFLHFVSI